MQMLERIQEGMEENREAILKMQEKKENEETREGKDVEEKPGLQSVARGEGSTTTERVVEVISTGKEKQLLKFFGVDTSANALLEFLDHYKLCVEINQARGVPGWDSPVYRAKELRYQLQGEVAVYVRQEEAMGQVWMNNDEEMVEKLKERWLNRDCIELDIIEFEEARQGEFETLAQFMQRLKGLGQRAFGEFDANGMHQRIIWRFLDGVRDKDVRSEIIRERWMKDRKTPKPYDEVLKIAENAKLLKVAAGATGQGSLSGKSRPIQIGAATRGSVSRRSRGASSRGDAPRAFDCFYCKQRHVGGWRACEKRKREDPDWEPVGNPKRPDTSPSSYSSSSRGSSGQMSPVTPPSDSNSSFR